MKYKHKLNMLEPGLKMIKVMCVTGILAVIFYITKLSLLCYIFGGLTLLLGIILWILLIIESHQDKVLNEQAIQERRINGEQSDWHEKNLV
jgi:hypothetical protein